MTEPDFDLLADAQEYARARHGELTQPDEDIMPVMLWAGKYGGGALPMVPFNSEADKDRVAELMTATLTVARATQAVAINTAYMAGVRIEDASPSLKRGLYGPGDKPASQRPDRIEVVTLLYDNMTRFCACNALVTRRAGKPPLLGTWDTQQFELDHPARGRFGNAIHLGLLASKEMPQAMADIIDEAWAEGGDAVPELVTRWIKVQRNYIAQQIAERGRRN